MTPTTTLFNQTDPRQPTEAEVLAAAEALIDNFEGDLGRARAWAIDEAIRYNAEGDRTRNLIAVRLSRAVKQITRQAEARPVTLRFASPTTHRPVAPCLDWC